MASESAEIASGDTASAGSLPRPEREWLRMMIGQLPAALWTTDTELCITACEGRGLELVHLTPADVLGKSIREFLGNDDSYPGLATHLAALRGESAVVEIEFQSRIGQWTVNPLRDESGRIVGCVGFAIDITERKQSEQSLHESEQRLAEQFDQLEHIYQTAPVGLCLMSTDLKFVRINERLAAINGKPVDEHIGRTLHDIIPHIADSVEEIYRRVLDSGNPVLDLEVRGQTDSTDGNEGVWLINYHPVFDRQERIVGVSSVVQDVTERTRAAESLRAAHKRWQTVIETMNEGFYIRDPGEIFTFVNRTLCQLLGYRQHELIGAHTHQIVHESDLHIAEEITRRRQETVSYSIEINLKHKHGHAVPVILAAAPIPDESGQVRERFAIVTDISEQKKHEQDLSRAHDELEQRVLERTAELEQANARLHAEVAERQTTEQRLQSILDNTTAVVYAKDREGRYVLNNRRHEELFHFPPGFVPGKTDGELFSAEVAAAFNAIDQDVWKSGQPVEVEEIAYVDGVPRTFISVKFLLTDEHDQPYALCGISTDITEWREAAEKVARHQDELAHVARLNTMGEMASGLAHELNQPLTSIVGYVQGCLRRLRSGDWKLEELVENLERAAAQAMRGGRIISRIRKHVQSRDPQRDPVDINDAVREVVAMIERQAAEDEVQLSLELTEDLPELYADRIQIEQVILNLTRNALESLGSVEDRQREITIRTQFDGNGAERIALIVADNGPGIDPSHLEQVFDQFFHNEAGRLGHGIGDQPVDR